MGVSLGPIVGGFLLDALGWRWIFWAAVPFGLASFVVGWLVLPRTEERGSKDETYDLAGAVLLVPALALGNPGADAGIGVAARVARHAGIGGCIRSAVRAVPVRREENALARRRCRSVPRRDFAAGMIGVILGYALLYGMLFLMSFAFLKGLDNSARWRGSSSP